MCRPVETATMGLHQEQAKAMARAFTHIDHGAAVVGNDWLERHGSSFMGHAVELRQKLPGGYVEWLKKPGPDLLLSLDGILMPLIGLGVVDWSEDCDIHGARLTARWTSPRLVLSVHTVALHELPALLRCVEILNPGDTPLAVSGVATDRLSLRRDGAGVLTENLQRRSESADWTTRERTAAVELMGHGRLGLLLGLEEGGRFALFDPEPGCCALFPGGAHTVAPGQTLRLPWSFLIPYAGEPGEISRKTLGDVLLLLRDWRNAGDAPDGEPRETLS